MIGELKRINGMVIRMYSERGGKHNLPHIHVYHGEYECVIAIENAITLEGRLPKGKYDDIKDFIINNRDALMEDWTNLYNGISVKGRY